MKYLDNLQEEGHPPAGGSTGGTGTPAPDTTPAPNPDPEPEDPTGNG